MFKSVPPNHKFIRKFVFGLATLALSVGLTGCATNQSASNTTVNKDGGTTITIGVESGSPYAQWYKQIAPKFTKQTGIKVQFQDVPLDNMHDRFLTDAASGTGSIDIFTTDQPWISEFASQGFLQPLDEMLSQEDKKDFVPSALKSVEYKGKIYALPYLVHTPILYYRTDLFQKAGITKAPETWDEFREDAKKLNNPANGVYGTIVEGKQGVEPTTHLIDCLLQGGGSIMNGNKGTVDSPENIKTLNYLLGIQYQDKTSPQGAVSYDNADVHNLFMQGKVAMAINWPYMYSMANDPTQSKVAGKFAVAVQPKGDLQTSAAWSWGFGISSSSKHKKEAMEWLKWSTSKDVMIDFGKKFINPVSRVSAINALNADTNLKADDKNAIVVMSKAVQFGQNVTTNPLFPQIENRLSVALSKVMTQQSKPEDELKAAATDIQAILKK